MVKHAQRGFIDIPRGFFTTVFTLAAVCLVALLCICVYGLYWLLTHVQFV